MSLAVGDRVRGEDVEELMPEKKKEFTIGETLMGLLIIFIILWFLGIPQIFLHMTSVKHTYPVEPHYHKRIESHP
jgi:hypothetical protein